MAIKRPRRRGRPQTVLPLHSSSARNAVSCWYCDFKIHTFNEALFSLGRRYSRFIKMWFTVGAAFSLVILTGVSLMLLWDSTDALTHPLRTSGVNGLLQRWLFGTTFLFPGRVSILDASSMIISTMLSVGVHEFGHGIAAASEGLRIEYIAVFLAIFFPGALVAFDYDWLQSLPQSSALRIYCAGIWHNITFSAACFLTLISLPVILHPFYLYGQGPLDETCMAPVQIPGMSWVEVTYSSPYSSQCLEYRSNASTYSENYGFDSTFCGGTFVFIGDAFSLAHSIHLSAYQPRWIFTAYMAHMPDVLEKFLACCFHISASLALVNSLPVFFLDGESILETVLCYFTFLKRRPRLRFLRFCLVGGTILSIISFSRLLYFMIVARE